MEISKKIKSLYTAEILGIIGEVLTVVCGVLLLSAAVASTEATSAEMDGIAGFAGVTGILTLVGAVLAIVAAVMQLVAVTGLRTVNKNFESAFVWLIGVIVLQVIDAFLTNSSSTLAGISDCATKVLEFMMIYYVSHGCADACNNAEITKKVKDVTIYILIAVGCSLVAEILAAFGVSSGFVTLFGDLCTLVYYFMYLSVLSKSAKALA